MSERPYTPGYRLNSTIVLRDLYRLVAVLLSLVPIESHGRDDDDPLITLRERFAEDEIVHLVVSAAISNRLQLQHMRQLREDPNELSFSPIEGACGSLVERPGQPSRSLGFRDACNKLIHAQDIVLPDIRGPVLRLTGEQWVAEVDMLQYARLSVLNFDDALA
jgi:hypothetical protein